MIIMLASKQTPRQVRQRPRETPQGPREWPFTRLVPQVFVRAGTLRTSSSRRSVLQHRDSITPKSFQDPLAFKVAAPELFRVNPSSGVFRKNPPQRPTLPMGVACMICPSTNVNHQQQRQLRQPSIQPTTNNFGNETTTK